MPRYPTASHVPTAAQLTPPSREPGGCFPERGTAVAVQVPSARVSTSPNAVFGRAVAADGLTGADRRTGHRRSALTPFGAWSGRERKAPKRSSAVGQASRPARAAAPVALKVAPTATHEPAAGQTIDVELGIALVVPAGRGVLDAVQRAVGQGLDEALDGCQSAIEVVAHGHDMSRRPGSDAVEFDLRIGCGIGRGGHLESGSRCSPVWVSTRPWVSPFVSL